MSNKDMEGKKSSEFICFYSMSSSEQYSESNTHKTIDTTACAYMFMTHIRVKNN